MKRTAKYLIPASYYPEDLKEAIAKSFQVKCLARKNTTRIYFDTFDWLLYGAGLGLYLENNQYVLHLLDTGETVAACTCKGRTRPRFWWDFEDPGIRSDLKRYIDVRCLLPYVSARLKFRRLNLLNLDGKTVLSGTLEDLSVKQEHKFATVTETFRIVPLRGYEGELTRLDDLLPDLHPKPFPDHSGNGFGCNGHSSTGLLTEIGNQIPWGAPFTESYCCNIASPDQRNEGERGRHKSGS